MCLHFLFSLKVMIEIHIYHSVYLHQIYFDRFLIYAGIIIFSYLARLGLQFGAILNNYFVNILKVFISAYVPIFLLNTYSEVKSLSYAVNICENAFPKWLFQLHSNSIAWDFQLLLNLINTLFNFSCSSGCVVDSHGRFNYHLVGD